MGELINKLLEIIQDEVERKVEYTGLSEIRKHQEELNLYLALQNYKERYLQKYSNISTTSTTIIIKIKKYEKLQNPYYMGINSLF